MEALIDYMIENFPQENQPEEAEPKPRWRDKISDSTYAVREVDDKWFIWCYDGRDDYRSSNHGINECYTSEQKAIDALDEWCAKDSYWERCDEEKEPKPRWHACEGKYTYTVRELDNGWVIWYDRIDGESRQSKDLETRGLFAEEQGAVDALDNRCESLLQWERCDEEKEERAKPEPVTREQLEESVDYLHDETSNDHVAHRHYDRAKRFIGEVQASDQNT